MSGRKWSPALHDWSHPRALCGAPVPAPREKFGYDAKSITVLEGLEAVRKRPGMYIGSTGERGLHHLVYEVVDNAVDEALAGYCDTIDVTLLADGGVRGHRQRPRHPGRHAPGGEAAGRRGRADHAARRRQVRRQVLRRLRRPARRRRLGGQRAVQPARRRDPARRLRLDPAYTVGGKPGRLGSRASGDRRDRHHDHVLGRPDDLRDTTTTPSRRSPGGCRRWRSSTRGCPSPCATSATTSREVVYHYEGGIEDFVRHLNATKNPIHKSVIDFGETEGMAVVEVAMQWNDTYAESVYTFANTINTHEGGTHEEGFRAALTTVVNKYARDKKMLKEKDDNLTGDDIREGLTAIISVKLADPQFEGQTKTKLGNTEAKSFVQKACNDWLGRLVRAQPGRGQGHHHQGDRRPRGPGSPPARPATWPGARACWSRRRCPASWPTASRPTRRECEVYIVEGDSAGGSAKGGRDPQFQAILPIRGKILNVEKAPDRPGAEEHRGPGADHRAGHRHPRRVRHRQAALPQDRADGRRRRRRPAHPDPAADAAVPVHAAAGRGRATSTSRSRRSTRSSGTRRDDASTPTPTGSATA